MIYYVKDNSLYSTDTPLESEGFVEIGESEYLERLNISMQNREQGTPLGESDSDFAIGFSGATENDYIEALESLGVEFNG